jgi:hypothetical protein
VSVDIRKLYICHHPSMMKTLSFLTLFTLTLFIFTSCNYLQKPECDGNCVSGYGIKMHIDGGYEKGNWHNSKLRGFGKQFFGSSSKYAGDSYIGWFNKGYNGYGVYYGKKLGFIYKGYWKNGAPDGYGESVFGHDSSNPGWSYKGEWKDGKQNGYGILYMGTVGIRAGVKYVGYWVNDNMEGPGKYYWPDGSVYDGHFANDLFDGKATFTFSDGYKFIGDWHQGYSSDFKKILAWHTKQIKSGDSTLNKFFSE